MEEGSTGHFEGVLEGWVALWFVLGRGGLGGPDLGEVCEVSGWVAGHVADGNGDAVVHAYDAELGDGILLEELVDELGDVLKGNNEAVWAHVLFSHGNRHVENDDQVSDDASLERCSVFDQPLSLPRVKQFLHSG